MKKATLAVASEDKCIEGHRGSVDQSSHVKNHGLMS